MKKFLKWLKDLIFRHKLLFLICLVAFVIIIVMIYVFFNIFIGGNGKYGDRLKGIETVELSEKTLTKIEKKIEDKEEVTSASVRVQGKIIYIHIELNRKTSLDRAKEIAVTSLEEFSKEEKSFYDFGYSLTQVKEDGNDEKGYVVTGTKNAKLDSISWIKS